jgi:hypothetical protein
MVEMTNLFFFVRIGLILMLIGEKEDIFLNRLIRLIRER